MECTGEKRKCGDKKWVSKRNGGLYKKVDCIVCMMYVSPICVCMTSWTSVSWTFTEKSRYEKGKHFMTECMSSVGKMNTSCLKKE